MKGTISVGRSPDCDMILDDSHVSGRHAEVSISGSDGVFITDCGSRNGTFIIFSGKKTRIKQQHASNDTIVVFGSYQIRAEELNKRVRALLESKSAHAGNRKNRKSSESEKHVFCPECRRPRPRGTVCPVCKTRTRGARG